MADRAELQSLLERVERATGPDLELDLDLARALVPDVVCLRHNRDTGDNEPFTHWKYTASIDAALALVERVAGGEGTRSMVYSIDLNWHASAHSEMAYVAELFVAEDTPPDMVSYHAQSHTWPLAILSALLRALIAQSDADLPPR